MRQFIIFAGMLLLTVSSPLIAAETFTPPVSPHTVFNFNPGWKFIRANATNAEQVAFDDSKWADVSAPHTFNDVDSYTAIISHSGGDRQAWSGVVWYRKHFKLPASRSEEHTSELQS